MKYQLFQVFFFLINNYSVFILSFNPYNSTADDEKDHRYLDSLPCQGRIVPGVIFSIALPNTFFSDLKDRLPVTFSLGEVQVLT